MNFNTNEILNFCTVICQNIIKKKVKTRSVLLLATVGWFYKHIYISILISFNLWKNGNFEILNADIKQCTVGVL